MVRGAPGGLWPAGAVSVMIIFVFGALAVVAVRGVTVFLLDGAVSEDVFFVFISGAAFS